MILTILILAAIGVALTLVTGGMTARFNKEDRRQRAILEAHVEAQQRVAMLTHASLQAVRDQVKRT